MNNIGTKYVRIMKQTAFRIGKHRKYIPCLKYSVPRDRLKCSRSVKIRAIDFYIDEV